MKKTEANIFKNTAEKTGETPNCKNMEDSKHWEQKYVINMKNMKTNYKILKIMKKTSFQAAIRADTARTRCSCRLHHKKLINHMSIVNLRRWTKLCDAFPFWRFHSCCLQGLACKIAPKLVPGLASCIPQVHDPPQKTKNKNAACPTHIEDLPNQPQVSEALLFNFGG